MPQTPASSLDLMPAPFAWIDIPGKGYSIAKYPVTNAQFARFVDAGGYHARDWWTKAGWEQQEYHRSTEPVYWRDSQWNGAEQPVVGVSWHAAVAFCLWLGAMTGERIMLPTEDQWQYAAQGDDGRAYPWGNEWDGDRCNNSVRPYASRGTQPVTRYEGKGDSPFGVVEMTGNVQEWCLTDYENKTNDIQSDAYWRVLRGGSYNLTGDTLYRCDSRGKSDPFKRADSWGFRLART